MAATAFRPCRTSRGGRHSICQAYLAPSSYLRGYILSKLVRGSRSKEEATPTRIATTRRGVVFLAQPNASGLREQVESLAKRKMRRSNNRF